MHLLRKYDVFGYAENDAMFAKKSLGEAVIIHEVNIISETTSFAKGKHHSKNKSKSFDLLLFLEAPPRIELGIRALQAPALPLGHGAILSFKKKGCLKRSFKHPVERITRLELATSTLARWRSTR